MQPQTGNKCLQQKWDNASFDLQRRKVKLAKTTLDMTAPKPYDYDHFSVKLKNLKLKDDLTTKIQGENHRLQEKISHIMRTGGTMEYRHFYEQKSLNQRRRQNELLRITKENEAIQLRLNQCKPHYYLRSWKEDWIKTLQIMDSIARYPRGDINQQMKKEQKNTKKSSATIKILNKADPRKKEKKSILEETSKQIQPAIHK